jgi:hypothetical protein
MPFKRINPYEESGGEVGSWEPIWKQEEQGWDVQKKRKRTKKEQDLWMKINRPKKDDYSGGHHDVEFQHD